MTRRNLFWHNLFSQKLLIIGMVFIAGFAMVAPDRAYSAGNKLSYSKTVRHSAPAVVTVYAKRVVKANKLPRAFERFFGRDPLFNRKRVERALGSGVIVNANGFIVTNHHVIKDARDLTVSLYDRREFEAKLILSDEASDLAVLRIDLPKGEKLPFLQFGDSDKIEVGDLVLAIGNPFGVGQTITSGIISAVSRSQSGINDMGFFLQTDAATNQGNSGGALVTLDGKLVGINTAIYSKSAAGFIGIGFAIPSNIVDLVAKAAISGGQLNRPWFGATLQNVTAKIASTAGLDRPSGVLIADIYPNSPAAKAGLKIGDIILKISNKNITAKAVLLYHIALSAEKKRVPLVYLRNGKTRKTQLRIEFPPMKPAPDYKVLAGQNPLLGVKVGNLSPALAIKLRLAPETRGVVVIEVKADSKVKRFLRKGDLILSVNGESVQSVAHLRSQLKAKKAPWAISLRRGRQNLTLNQK